MPTKMTHPDTKQTIEVDEDQVSMYARQGWQTPKAKAAPKK